MSGNLKELQARVRELERAEAERKLVEEKLRESEARFRNLAQTTSTAIMVYQNDRWIYANPAAEKMCGYTLDGLREMNFWDFVAPGYVDRVKQMGRNRQRMLNAESGYEFEIVTRDGERKWVYLEGTSAEVDGKPAGLISVTDITKRKRAEEALKKSHQGFIETLESLNELVIQLDSDYTIKVSNRAASTLMGIPREQFPGKHCYSLFY